MTQPPTSHQLAPVREAKRCRACGSGALEPFMDFGFQPLATLPGRRRPEEPEWRFRKVLDHCPACGHTQLRHAVDPDLLYARYPRLYSSSVPDYERALAREAGERARRLGGYLLEIGCNGGVFLEDAARTGARVLGVDAAANCVEATRKRGLDCESGYFRPELADSIARRYGRPATLVCRHVIEHIDDASGFLHALAWLMGPASEAYVETPDFADSAQLGDDTCFTEQHLSYFVRRSLEAALGAAGLRVVEWRMVPNNWSRAILARVRRGDSTPRLPPGAGEAGFAPESARERFREGRRAWESIIERVANLGELALGAAYCRSSNLLTHSEALDENRFRMVAEDDPDKLGRRLSGTNLPIEPFASLEKLESGICLLGTVGFEDRLLRRHRSLIESGVAFAMPFPPRIAAVGALAERLRAVGAAIAPLP